MEGDYRPQDYMGGPIYRRGITTHIIRWGPDLSEGDYGLRPIELDEAGFIGRRLHITVHRSRWGAGFIGGRLQPIELEGEPDLPEDDYGDLLGDCRQ